MDQTALNTAAQSATYGGASAAIVSAHLSLSDWAAVISATVAVAGFLLQLYLALRALRRLNPP